MPQNEVETLEAALNFISQYELSSAAPTDAVDLTLAFEHSHKLNKAHSLEVPEQRHAFTYSHSLEVPNDEVAVATAAFDAGLHAAEEFLEDFNVEKELFNATDSELQDVLSLSVRPTMTTPFPSRGDKTATASAATLSPTSGPRRRRVSKKEEISELRDTVAELSQQLDELQTYSAPNSPDMYVRSIVSQPESLWQQIAARQLVLRQQAEEANAQLRTIMENRVRQTKNLKRMLSRRNDSETLELIGLKRRKQIYRRGTPPKDNEEVFAKLLQGTDELYVGLDKLFADQGMPQVPCPGRKRQVQRNAVNGAIVVLLDKNQVPFDLEKTGRAVWKLLAQRHRQDGPYKHGRIDCESQQTGNTVTNFVSFTCVAGNLTSLLQVREVARKYVTDERAAFICRSIMEPTNQGESVGLKFHETMTVVVSRGEPLSSGQETTIIESYLCATRQDEGTEMARKFRGKVYVDIAIEGWEQALASNKQDIENLLFEEAIRVR
ncbi:hypothetical protein PF008_g7840 [Phytophthora fragariae]|uniref:M96 mating-specific protein family n=1 Tax=Phytophthora fragariae TaxID=53985 RepID=A0A6G0S1Y0_9STRA|nr:hypothetical protein PF008_g7840 [Phytophthora fragariae]